MKYVQLFAENLNYVIMSQTELVTNRLEKKKENCTIIITKGNSNCRHKSSARGPPFKVSSEGLVIRYLGRVW